MLEQKQKSKNFQEVLDQFPENAKKGLLELQNFAFEQYKKEGSVVPFSGFFTIKEEKLVVFKAGDMKMMPPELLNNKIDLRG